MNLKNTLAAGLVVATASAACNERRGVDLTVCPDAGTELTMQDFAYMAYLHTTGGRDTALNFECTQDEAASMNVSLEDCGIRKTLIERGFVSPDVDFTRLITREEAAEVLTRIYNLELSDDEVPFTDADSVAVDVLYTAGALNSDPAIEGFKFYPTCNLGIDSASAWVKNTTSKFSHETFCGELIAGTDFETQIRRSTDIAQIGCIVSNDSVCLTYDCSTDPTLRSALAFFSSYDLNCGGAESQSAVAAELIELQSQCDGVGLITYGDRVPESCYLSRSGPDYCGSDF